MKTSENEVATPVTTPQNAAIAAFEPASTVRAKKRAEFEAKRALNEQNRLEKDTQDREQRVKELYKELNMLREVI